MVPLNYGMFDEAEGRGMSEGIVCQDETSVDHCLDVTLI